MEFPVQKGMRVRYTGPNSPMRDWCVGEVRGLRHTGQVVVDFGNDRVARCDPENLEAAK